MKRIYLLLAVLWLLSCRYDVFAQTELITNNIEGIQVADSARFDVHDDKFNDSFSGTIDSTYSTDDYVYLEMAENIPVHFAHPFVLSITLQITDSSITNTVTTFLKTLTIHYDTVPGKPYNYSTFFHFTGGHGFVVKVMNMSYSVFYNNDWSSPNVYTYASAFRVRGLMKIQRSYYFACASSDSGSMTVTVNNGGQYIGVAWDPVPGANEYDLQWTFYDDSSTAAKYLVKKDPSAYNYDTLFNNNATTITVSSGPYNIPLNYPPGFIFVRMRPVELTRWGQRVEGVWKYPYNSFNLLIVYPETHWQGLNDSLNWQASSSFAEDGIHKGVVNYFDGTLRNRQSVTVSNAEGLAIIGETYYDYNGRPAVKSLPVPGYYGFNNTYEFHRNFNLDSLHRKFSWYDFDTLGCGFKPMNMDSGSGASWYYSSKDSDASKLNYQRFVPDAYNYPFIQTEYTPDNTGRISRQSGAGKDFILGSDHETKYGYGKPTQWQIDRLFGSEVGNNSHYLKNMVIDPNGQISVSYIDAHGRVIATALAGDAPPNLQAVSDKTDSVQVSENIIKNTATNMGTVHQQTSTYPLLAENTAKYFLSYSLYPDAYKDPTCHDTLCYDCYYTLDIKVSGTDCYSYEKKDSNYTLNDSAFIVADSAYIPAFDTTCHPTGMTDTVTLNLSAGQTYTITKTLTVSQYPLTYYTDRFIQQDTCLYSFQHFVNKAMSSIDTGGCNMTCTSCLAQLGTRDTFAHRFITQVMEKNGEDTTGGTHLADSLYVVDSMACAALCNTDPCAGALTEMLQDVSPGGQYAEDTLMADSVLVPKDTSDPSSIFYYNPSLHEYKYQNPCSAYLNFNGKPDSVTITSPGGGSTEVPPTALSPEQFIAYFQPWWANSLVQCYHPEWCDYEWCDSNARSNVYEQDMLNTSTYAAAMDSGFLNPLGNYGSDSYGRRDPFFKRGGFGAYDSTAARNYLMSYKRVYYNIYYSHVMSMWALSRAIVSCTASNDIYCIYLSSDTVMASGSDCQGDMNAAWIIFRSCYLGYKDSIEDASQMSDNVACNGVTHACIGKNLTNIDHQAGCITSPNYYAYKMPRFFYINNNNLDTVTEEGTLAKMVTQCDSICTDNVGNWLNTFDSCTAYNGLSAGYKDSIQYNLIRVCEGGCDGTHPFGASSGIPTGVKDGSQTFYSFEDVFNYFVYTAHSESIPHDTMCTAYHIEFPGAYDHPADLGQTVLITKDSCVCSKLNTYYSYYKIDSAAHHTSYSTFTAYIDSTLKMQLPDSTVSQLLNLCNSNCNYLVNPITIPNTLSCAACISCEDIAQQFYYFLEQENLYDSLQYYIYEFPPMQDTSVIHASLAIYLNHSFGFNYTYTQYMNFISQCGYNENDYVAQKIIDTPAVCPTGNLTIYNITSVAQANNIIHHFHDTHASQIMLMGVDTLPQQLITWFQSIDTSTFVSVDSLTRPYPVGHGLHDSTLWNSSTERLELAAFQLYPGQSAPTPYWGYLFNIDSSVVKWALYNTYYSHNPNSTATVPVNIGWYYESPLIYAGSVRFWIPPICDTGSAKKGDVMLNPNHPPGGWQPNYYDMLNYDSTMFIDDVDDPYTMPSVLSYPPILVYIDTTSTVPDCDLCVFSDPGFISTFDSVIVAYEETYYPSLWAMDEIGPYGVYIDYRIKVNDSTWDGSDPNYMYWNGDGYDIYTSDQDSYEALPVYHYPKWITDTVQGTPNVYCSPNLCGSPWFPPAPIDSSTCVSKLIGLALSDAQTAYQTYIDSVENSFANNYIAQCMNVDDQLYLTAPNNEYHYTLYYYDQAGNLVKTIPPNGVHPIAGSDSLTAIENYRKDTTTGAFTRPHQDYVTRYWYNTLNQMIKDSTPDGDTTHFWYDRLGRLAVSQNTKQVLDTEFSYTTYDALGRIAEVGQFKPYPFRRIYIPGPMNDSVARSDYELGLWLGWGTKNQITNTYYDSAHFHIPHFTQNNLLNRVASVIYKYYPYGTTVCNKNITTTLNPNHPSGGWQPNDYDMKNYDSTMFINSLTGLPVYMPSVLSNPPILVFIDTTETTGYSADFSATFDSVIFAYFGTYDPGYDTSGFIDFGFYIDYRMRINDSTWQGYEPEYFHFNPDSGYTVTANDTQVVLPTYHYPKWLHDTTLTCDTVPYKYATHYSYDIQGNVKTVVQDIPALQAVKNRYKRIDYDYDLVSGKVNDVYYEKDSVDEFIQQYQYDDDLRLTDVLTSTDSVQWDEDAQYNYYNHGPLARMVLGRLQVQGVDYAYTINGWLKGINSTSGLPAYDMGTDGMNVQSHNAIGQDAYGVVLGYYNHDYRAISTASYSNFEAGYAGSNFDAGGPGLYNGNIRNMTVTLRGLPKTFNGTDSVRNMDPIGYAYNYDQLNRLVQMRAYNNFDTSTNSWQSGGAALHDYAENVSYDGNGNILKYIRHGNPTIGITIGHTAMDSMTYFYNGHNNQLNHVADGVPKSYYTVDIDSEVNNNYLYDKKGEMTFDSLHHLTIAWDVRNKVSTVKNDSTRLLITYNYDAMGNRVMKQDSNLTTHVSYTTWYIRDAQGNLLSTYKEKNDSLYWKECDIYGSSRVGVYYPDSLIYPKGAQVKADSLYTMQLWEGKKQYELTNHLGNVLTTVSDKLLPAKDSVIATGANSYDTVKYYRPEIISATDYFVFGMIETGRNFHLSNDSNYHFGFNGKWKDDDIKGNGNSIDFGDRMNDTRLGRLWSTDRFSLFYTSVSDYAFALNNPVLNLDNGGDFVIEGTDAEKTELQKIVEAAKKALATNPFLLEELKKYSGLTDEEIKWIFKDNQGPTLHISHYTNPLELGDELGSTSTSEFLKLNPDAGKETISLSDLFGSDNFNKLDPELGDFLTTMTLLHELVHLGDKRTGIRGANPILDHLTPDEIERIQDAQEAYLEDKTNPLQIYKSHTYGEQKYRFEPGKAFEVAVANYGISDDENLATRFRDFVRNALRYNKQQEQEQKQKDKGGKGNSSDGSSSDQSGGGNSSSTGGDNAGSGGSNNDGLTGAGDSDGTDITAGSS